VNLEPFDSSSFDSSNGVPEIIGVSSYSDSDDSIDFEPEMEVDLEVKNGESH
jgi:hypothetical protein